MAVTNAYLNALRDQHNIDETAGLIGTDNTPASPSDIALGNQVGSKAPVSSFTGNVGEITKIFQYNADDNIGDTIQEIGFTTKAVLQSREVITAITKSANEVVQIRHKTTYREGV
jgi:hypothetical protein